MIAIKTNKRLKVNQGFRLVSIGESSLPTLDAAAQARVPEKCVIRINHTTKRWQKANSAKMLIPSSAKWRLEEGVDPDTLKMVNNMEIDKKAYIPAMNKAWLTPLYDPFLRYVMREEVFKRRLVALADPQPGQRILDIGCGTGTLTLMIKQAQPAAVVVGLDADEDVLEIARRKSAQNGGKEILWRQGYSYALPFSDETFDLVIASMMLHHLTGNDKLATFREIRRTLNSGGRFWIVDFGPAHDPIMQLVSKFFSHFEHTRDHFRGLLPGLLQEAGFSRVAEVESRHSPAGPLSIYRAM